MIVGLCRVEKDLLKIMKTCLHCGSKDVCATCKICNHSLLCYFCFVNCKECAHCTFYEHAKSHKKTKYKDKKVE